MIVLDTHALVWWTSSPELLSPAAGGAIAQADRLGVSAISFWEVSLLVRKSRLTLGMSLRDWVRQVQDIPRIHALPLTAELALDADALEMHADPADRFIVATARASNAALVSKDALLQSLGLVKVVW